MEPAEFNFIPNQISYDLYSKLHKRSQKEFEVYLESELGRENIAIYPDAIILARKLSRDIINFRVCDKNENIIISLNIKIVLK